MYSMTNLKVGLVDSWIGGLVGAMVMPLYWMNDDKTMAEQTRMAAGADLVIHACVLARWICVPSDYTGCPPTVDSFT